MTWLLIGISILFILSGLSKLLPRVPQESAERERLMNIIGFTSVQKSAAQIGLKLKARDYLILLALSLLFGYLIAVFTDNYLFVVVGAMLCFFVPRYIVSTIQYKRRREALLDLPKNLRVLASKFRDCKSLQRSLEASLPMMTGVTKPVFLKLYRSLEIGIDMRIALREAQDELRFQKFDDLCGKLITGNREGFSARAVSSIRETIDDISKDISDLQTLDIENKNKRLQVHAIVLVSWTFPFLFAYMESELDVTPTLQTVIGKILLVTMFLSSLAIYLARDKYLRLNLKQL
ncbi:type II secretion system F family protein [Paenibacillus alvei]|uniref:type II secretion system F family protein n=1 Tax=Paenibacillus alvei TaxID=44250 RepID=UPI00228001BD|nr:hypothetical protein [Paenibacillus alvei]